MRTAIGLLLAILMAQPALCAQFGSGHKSEEQIARMTPDQRVEEFCKEHARHLFSFHDEYEDLLKGYLFKDGLKVIPQVIREIEAYDPTRRESAGQQKFRRYEAAVFILSQFDWHVFRVRAFAEGRQAIEALKRSSENHRIAHLNSKEDEEYEMRRRYELHLSYIRQLEGNSFKDEFMQKTLKTRYNISLSDEELSAFVNYLIEKDPYYPSWSKVKSELLVNPEQYYQAYLEYKAKNSEPKRSR